MTKHTPRPLGSGLANVDPNWAQVRAEAEVIVAAEPELATFVYTNVLTHDRLESAVAYRIASRLHHEDVPSGLIEQAYGQAALPVWTQDEAGPYQAIPQPGSQWRPTTSPAHCHGRRTTAMSCS